MQKRPPLPPPPPASLPPEIVTEVLSRLPDYQTLTHCKSVCKEWRSLISDPTFAKTRNPRLATWRLCKILLWGFGSPPPYITLTTSDSAKNQAELHLTNFGRNIRSRPCLAGSCNGILYIQNPNSDAVLLNPAMRSSTRIPPHGVHVTKGVATGLGYDHTTDDYKALVIVNKEPFGIDVRIFSLRNKLWKSVKKNVPEQSDLATCIFRDYDGRTSGYDNTCDNWRGTTIGGSPHWTGMRADDEPVLIRFDVVREEFVDVGLPVRPENGFAVGELEGEICATFKCENGSLEGWSRKLDDNGDQSWRKVFSFSPKIQFERLKLVVGDLRLGEVVMELDRNVSLSKFNINDNSRQVITCLEGRAGYAHYVDSPNCPWNNNNEQVYLGQKKQKIVHRN